MLFNTVASVEPSILPPTPLSSQKRELWQERCLLPFPFWTGQGVCGGGEKQTKNHNHGTKQKAHKTNQPKQNNKKHQINNK